MEVPDIHQKIRSVYGFDASDIKSGKLLDIFVRVHEQESGLE